MSAADDEDWEGGLPPPPGEGPGFFGDAAAPVTAAAPAGRHTGSYRVLARAYRPVGFDDLIGQDATVRILRRAFATGRVAHAFMLTGVRGVGKTTIARIIARALTCTGPDGTGGPTADPCGVCPNCTAILADRHPDVLELDAASRTGVDDVREIIEATRFRPMQARAKVFIVDEVHMLSRNAFNALLKTLEEPPDHVTFVFATTELRKVPVTVLSRCQRFDLRRVPAELLAAHFGTIAARENVRASADALAAIARAADGSVRDGLSLLDQAIATAPRPDGDALPAVAADAVADMLGLADRARVFDLLEAVLAGRAAEALAINGALGDRGADPAQVLGDLLDLVHVLSRLKAIPSLAAGQALPELERVRGAALAARVTVPVLGRCWQMLLKGLGEIEGAPNRQSAADMVMIRLCHVADGPTPGELVRRLASAGNGGSGTPLRTVGADAAPAHAPSGGPVAAGPRDASGAPSATAPGGPSGPDPGHDPGPGHGHGHGAAAGSGNGGRARALARPAPAFPPPDPSPRHPPADPSPLPDAPPSVLLPAPRPSTWREIVALLAERGRDPLLLANLRHRVSPVRVVPPIVEIRQLDGAPRDLAARLGAALTAATGQRWTVALSTEAGTATLAERAEARRRAAHAAALADPIVVAILDAFPGATVSIARNDDVADDAPEDASPGGHGAEHGAVRARRDTADDPSPLLPPDDAEGAERAATPIDPDDDPNAEDPDR